ncbi:putative tRNA pseudouridine synthase A [Blattamonas nauphoetae]|uniref:tRNA pseudouridine synthase A n=1 Tax=Blattamonas nauphoetae TaxID=2049346 RepID=A0ABQ9Y4G6_9EUKA|nr:putative tRNA pseudouridine synthase A [Blattamonas nauphoetae]
MFDSLLKRLNPEKVTHLCSDLLLRFSEQFGSEETERFLTSHNITILKQTESSPAIAQSTHQGQCLPPENITKSSTHPPFFDKPIKRENPTPSIAPPIAPQHALSSDGKKKKKPDLNVLTCPRRHIAIQLYFDGLPYFGFAYQNETTSTVEKTLFDGLIRSRLIHSRETCNLTRCGRTDKGVHGFSQVISVWVRSVLPLGSPGVYPPMSEETSTQSSEQISRDIDPVPFSHSDVEASDELPYLNILNGVLPPSVRAYAFVDVDPVFNSRFHCKTRSYRYFFPKGTLDLSLMNEAAKLLEGEHDFKRFCKQDKGKTNQNTVRIVYSASVLPVSSEYIESHSSPLLSLFNMCNLQITANGFLFHQIRCIMSVLFRVGLKIHPPSIVLGLFGYLENTLPAPSSPSEQSHPPSHFAEYELADDSGLVLWDAKMVGATFLPSFDAIQKSIKELAVEISTLETRLAIKRAYMSTLWDMECRKWNGQNRAVMKFNLQEGAQLPLIINPNHRRPIRLED